MCYTIILFPMCGYNLYIYINVRRSRDGKMFVCACVRSSVRSFVRSFVRSVVLPSLHSVRFGQHLRCVNKCTSKGKACLFN